ncbi:MAG: hypothetical protein ACI8QZ_004018 [Chlamydiales bacterium]|jgi:hypothetical protein
MQRINGTLVGLIAGAIGTAAWAAIVHFTGYEIGYLAWGIGFIVGLGVAMGSKGEGDLITGALAVVISVLSIVAGKYAAAYIQVEQAFSAEAMEVRDEFLISYKADDVVEEPILAGETVSWPEGVSAETAAEELDYSADIWIAADGRWNAMTVADQELFRADTLALRQAHFDSFRPQARTDIFTESFAMIDLVFFGLAIATAFKLAAQNTATGHESSGEPLAPA